MTIRSTLCTLSLVAGSIFTGCTTPDARFGVHAGAEQASEARTATHALPYRTVYYDPNPFITEHHVAEFSRSRDESGNPAVSMRLTDEGTEIMREWSGQNVGNYAVMTLDGMVLSAPTLLTPIGRMIQVTTGSEGDTDWIEDVETALNDAGANPVERLANPIRENDIPGFQVYVASTERTETYWGGFPLLEHTMLWVDMEPLLTDVHVSSAARTRDENGNLAIGITLTDTGHDIMRARAQDYVEQYLVMTWRGRAVSAPYVITPLGKNLMVTLAGPGLDPELPDNWLDQFLQKHGG